VSTIGKAFNIQPLDLRRVATPFRKIVTKIPVPEAIEALGSLHRYGPALKTGQARRAPPPSAVAGIGPRP